MKKLLFILSAVFVSVMAWAQKNPDTGWDYLNPYAYDLKSEVINNGQTLHLTYKFNAPGFGNSDDYNKLNPKDGTGTGRGIQIYLLYKDEQGNWQRVQKDDNTGDYAIYSGGYNAAQEWSVNVNVIDIPKNCKGKELTWEAVVHGNIGRTTPKVVKASGTKPTNAYGIAVNNDPMHVRFAQMFVSEAFPSKREGWNYWKDRWEDKQSEYEYANTMLEYTPLLGFKCAHFKHYHNDTEKSHFASLWDWTNKYGDLTITSTYSYNYEPNRIKVSEDGRTFVSSFHPKASCVVLEYGKKRDEYNGHHFYNTIDNNWENNKDLDNISDKVDGNYNPFLYRRCVGMDVKGKGDNLKIILLWIDANAANYTISGKTVPAAKFIIYEYELGLAEAEGYIATNKYLPPFDNTGCKYVHKIGEYSWDYQGWSSGGAFYQGARYGTLNNNKRYLYNNMLRGFADLAYGTNDDVWVKIDYCAETAAKPKIIRVKLNNGTTTEYTINNGSTANYGGSGILIKDGMLITSPTNSTICLYEINANGELNATDKQPNAKHTIIDNQIGSWVTGFATDYAGNLFALTQASINGENYTANILGIAMPYKKAITTRARGTFVVNDPIPNILATDLRYEPVPKQPKYRFSFNVNTTPKSAQIRFYKSYGDNGDNDMKKNLAKINADDYQGGNEITPSFVYNIPDTVLKQGEIAVEFDMVGGNVDDNGVLTNAALPRGEWYWSVYVEAPRKSNVFAPIYEQSTSGEDAHHRLHATVNNYPETDGFGHIYAVNYYAEFDTKNGLMDYTINPDGNSNDEQNNIQNSNRYKLVKNYLNPTGNKPKFTNQRRLAVAPDGKVYIADCGQSYPFDANADRPWMFKGGGVFVWNPNTQTGNEIQISLFSTKDQNSTATGIDIYNHNGQLKLYATNTYGEFENHYTGKKYWKNYEYTEANQANVNIYGWNGFKEFNLGTPNDILLEETAGTVLHSLGMGDGNGNIGIVATDKGIWMAQHRLNDVQYTIDQFKNGVKNPALPDNTENYILSFVPYGNNTRTWTSCTTRGINYSGSTYDQDGASALTQLTTSPLQACPGAGLAYRKTTTGKEYLYIVNHEGNIVELQITSWDGTKPSVQYTKTYPGSGPKAVFQSTGRKQGVINTMCFDYAGNLITTSGLEYLGSASNQNIIVYTMPYDRVNAREIQAPNSCRFIPERTAYLEPRSEMELTLQPYVANTTPCYLDIFRPMPNTSFSTICLPFDLDMKQLTTEALKDAEVKQYKGLQLSDIGGEKMLELVFEDVPTADGKQILKANTPYIIQPKVRIPGIIQLQNPIQFVAIDEQSVVKETQDKEYAITFKGLIPTEQIEVKYANGQPLTLLLVAENRLAEMVPDAGTTGTIYGFRGYFELNRPLNGIGARITPKQSVSTSTTIIVDGKRVNIEKYLREGRVYIRVGDTLYTIDGQKVQ